MYTHTHTHTQINTHSAANAVNIVTVTQHLDEVVNSQLKQERYTEKVTKLQKGYVHTMYMYLHVCVHTHTHTHTHTHAYTCRDLKTFEEMFMFACPKFMSPIVPDYDSIPENYNKV